MGIKARCAGRDYSLSDQRYYGTRQAALRLGVNVQTVYRWVYEGKNFDPEKVVFRGNRILIEHDEVERVMMVPYRDHLEQVRAKRRELVGEAEPTVPEANPSE